MSVGPFPVAKVIAHLVARAPLLKLVGNAADLRTALAQKPNATPAAYVLSEERGGPSKYTGPMTQQDCDVQLQVVLMVKNVGGERTGAGARAEMDEVIKEVRRALIGWTPEDAFDSVTFRAGRDDSYDGGSLVCQQIFQTDYRIANQVNP